MTPNEFPYIKAIHVNDCFAYQNFDINLPPLNGKPFSHLILTGKNGSGKTTILRGVEQHIGLGLFGQDTNNSDGYANIDFLNTASKNPNALLKWKNKYNWYNAVELTMREGKLRQQKGKSIFSFLGAHRQANPKDVVTPTKETDFSEQFLKSISTDYFSQQFKQYFVNKKVQQAFQQIDNNTEGVLVTNLFFQNLTKILQQFFEDDSLTLIFEAKSYEFYVVLKGGRKITFNQMSDGFSAVISILADLLIRVDLIRLAVKDNSYDPCGIVLLDEPESHLHIKAQYEILPILTEFFPNVQFIVATYSPAVISSIKNTTVFDLTSQQTVTDEIVGSSYSELMVTHFGLDNEFSPIADEIIDNVEKALKENKQNKPLLKQKLQEIFNLNGRYLSPVLRLELNALIEDNS